MDDEEIKVGNRYKIQETNSEYFIAEGVSFHSCFRHIERKISSPNCYSVGIYKNKKELYKLICKEKGLLLMCRYSI